VDASVSIRSGPVIRGDLDVDIQAAIFHLALRQFNVFENEEFGGGFQLMDEATDIAVLTRQ
jgi:hypothetical protein